MSKQQRPSSEEMLTLSVTEFKYWDTTRSASIFQLNISVTKFRHIHSHMTTHNTPTYSRFTYFLSINIAKIVPYSMILLLGKRHLLPLHLTMNSWPIFNVSHLRFCPNLFKRAYYIVTLSIDNFACMHSSGQSFPRSRWSKLTDLFWIKHELIEVNIFT